MPFRITGLDPAPFRPLWSMTQDELFERGVQRCIADSKPGFPDRIELRDAEPGETLLLLNFTHQPADNPYHSRHAIFVREGATAAFDRLNHVPDVMRIRPISLRAFDRSDMMTSADLVAGSAIADRIEAMLADPAVAYIHAPIAKRGCFAARIERHQRRDTRRKAVIHND